MMNLFPKPALLVAGAALLALTLNAKAANLAENFDFSSPDVSGDNTNPYGGAPLVGYNYTITSGDSTTITDWTTGSTTVEGYGIINNTVNPQYASLPASNDQFAFINVDGDVGATGTLTQNLATDFVADDTYNLSVGVGANDGTTHDGTYILELLDNGAVVDSGTLDATTITSGKFATLSLATPYVATDDGSISIVLGFETSVYAVNQQGNFNDVQLNIVPEPSSTALMFGGLVLAALAFRRRLVS